MRALLLLACCAGICTTLTLDIQHDLRTGDDGGFPEVTTSLILTMTDVEAGYITCTARAYHRGPPPEAASEAEE